MSKFDRVLIGLACAYAVAGVVAFGPAAVEEDRLESAKKIECESTWSGDLNVSSCKAWARNEFRPLLKAMAWPLWLSYRVAKELAE